MSTAVPIKCSRCGLAIRERMLWNGAQVWHPECHAAPSDEPVLPPLPDVLFDGYAVLQALDKKAASRTSSENVADVMDAVVRLLRADRAALLAVPPQEALGGCGLRAADSSLTRPVEVAPNAACGEVAAKALEFAEYMAKRAEHLLASMNALHATEEAAADQSVDSIDAVENAAETVTEAMTGLRSGVYEFRKRAALAAAPKAELTQPNGLRAAARDAALKPDQQNPTSEGTAQ